MAVARAWTGASKRSKKKKSSKKKRARGLLLGEKDLVLPHIARTDPAPHYLAVVAVVKNEATYLEEWLDFHCLVGCSHFYIYDNGSTDGTVEILSNYERKGIVTPVPWPDFLPWSILHPGALAHALAAYGRFSRWMMFIDADEFVFPADGDDLKQELAAYEDLPALALPWHMFGPSGHAKVPKGFVIENYTQRAVLPPVSKRLIKGKSVVDPTRVRGPGTHRCIIDEGHLVFTQSRQIVRDPDWKFITPANDDRIILNHYFAKSLEEFCRRTTPAGAARRLNLVRLIENAVVEDRRIQRFLPQLKALQEPPHKGLSQFAQHGTTRSDAELLRLGEE
jgi:hypothetical protein